MNIYLKKTLSVLFAILMVFTVLPVIPLTASAGLDTTCAGGCDGDHTDYTAISGGKNRIINITKAGKYYLTGDITFNKGGYDVFNINCTGEVTLCLNGHNVQYTHTNGMRAILDIDG